MLKTKKYDPKKKILYTPSGPIKIGAQYAKIAWQPKKSSPEEFRKAMRKASEEELFALPEGYAE